MVPAGPQDTPEAFHRRMSSATRLHQNSLHMIEHSASQADTGEVQRLHREMGDLAAELAELREKNDRFEDERVLLKCSAVDTANRIKGLEDQIQDLEGEVCAGRRAGQGIA